MTVLNHMIRHQLQRAISELRTAIHDGVAESWKNLGEGVRRYPKIEGVMFSMINPRMDSREPLAKALMFLFTGNTPHIRTAIVAELQAMLTRGCDIKLAWINFYQLWDIAENGVCWDACFYDGETEALIVLEGIKALAPNASESDLLNDEAIKARIYVNEKGVKGMLNHDDMLHFLGTTNTTRLRNVFRV